MLKLYEKLREKAPDPLILRLLSSWCAAAIFFCLLTPGTFSDLKNYRDVPLWAVLLATAAVFALLTALRFLLKKDLDRLILPGVFGAYSLLTVFLHPDWYYAFILTALWAALVFYYRRKGLISVPRPMSARTARLIVTAVAVLFVIVVGGAGVFKYLSYRTPNFDFGIFCQMFYNMKAKFAPVTTCERDRLLSHFAVHLSPVYYLLLPVFAVFSSPLTLQVGQTLILASAVIPLALLCRRLELAPYKTALACVLFLLYPAVASGTCYDFHENCFLLPFLLWTFLFFEREKYLPMAVFALLTLTVKEDAAVYLIFFALFVILDRRRYVTGAALALGAAVWFAAALLILSKYGEGVMDGRYKNFIVADGGLAEAVKNVLANPGYAFTQMLDNGSGDASEKLLFLFQMFVPLAFLPFCVKKLSRLTLLFPLLLLNLLTLYRYQFDIGFQYTFGSAAFILYLSVLNLRDLREDTAKQILAVGAFCGLLCFVVGPAVRLNTFFYAWFDHREEIAVMDETLREIPADAAVSCSTFLLPHLADRETLYEVEYHKPAAGERLDYVILDCRFPYEKMLEKSQGEGYEVMRTVSAGGRPVLLVLTPGGEATGP